MISVKKITSNSYFQSAFVGVLVTMLVYFVWDAPIKKYEIELEPFAYKTAHGVHWFAGDFNGDGDSERIRCHHNDGQAISLSVVHYDENGNVTNHYHFPESEWNYNLYPVVFDIDSDGTQELLFFSFRNDSIFFNAFNLARFQLTIDHLYFNTYQRKRKIYSERANTYSFGDFDGNGTNELFFVFDAGYGLYPRGIFKIEFPSLKITSTSTEHMTFTTFSCIDFNKDGTPEIIGSTYAPENSDSCKNYTDTISYISAFDYELNFLFPPIPQPKKFASLWELASPKNDGLFYALYLCRSFHKTPCKIMVLNQHGKILNEKAWHNLINPESFYAQLKTINKIPYLFIRDIGHFRLTPQLDQLPNELTVNKETPGGVPYAFDLNNDGWDEWIYFDRKDKITIYNEHSKEYIEFVAPVSLYRELKIYPFLKKNRIIKYMIDTGAGFFFLKYHKNPFFFTLYLIYILVFSFTTGLIFAILYFQKRTIEKRLNTEKQLSELQFNSVKNQLNPHFLFNVLNSVAFMINEGKKEEAYDFLSINARMIQRVMNDANEVKRPLKDELQFTKDYVGIQKHRFKNRFEAEFTIHPDVDKKMQIPKMCIHTYVENAIKHGFRNTKSGGILKIHISPLARGVNIIISDNGMGREAASRYKDSSGNGLHIMNEFYRLFEKYHGYKIVCDIYDLAHATGTRVELKIQLD